MGNNERLRKETGGKLHEDADIRWMCGSTKKDKIRNEHVKGSVYSSKCIEYNNNNDILHCT